MEELTLVIMAAGMGSRFGGLKQIEPIGPNGEFIIDYSIYDAIKAGFNKVIFIIKKENLDIFKQTIGNRISDQITVEYAFQEIENVPSFVSTNRLKPWGTAHAIYSAIDLIKNKFLVINSDDFYGRDAFLKASQFLKNSDNFAVIGYNLENTLTENGSVKRGVCEVNANKLVKIDECLIEKKDELTATRLKDNTNIVVSNNTIVSMNMLAFNNKLLTFLKEDINNFFEQNINNLETCEYFIPDVVTKMMNNNLIDVEVIPTSSKWLGITYKEDKEQVMQAIEDLITNNIYPNNLWY